MNPHRDEFNRFVTRTGTKPGDSTWPEYRVWVVMKQRCTTPTAPQYANYGGRGISVCQRWSDDFRAFIADIGRRPSKQHSIERIDNDGNYEPGNVRWATRKEQCRNRTDNRWLEMDGQRMILSDWAEKYGINRTTIILRMKRGMSLRDALTLPLLTNGSGKIKKAVPGRIL